MPVIINGTTGLSGVSTVNLANGSVTQNILANGVSTTGPAFSATMSGNQSVTSNVVTKVALNSEAFDTNNCFDTALYRFTPNVAGYYLISARFHGGTTSITSNYGYIYKNGSAYAQGGLSASVSSAVQTTTELIYLNGTTDYVEMYGQISASTPVFYAGAQFTNFSGFLARAA